MFSSEKLVRSYKELCDIEGFKPFECVGTFAEARAAFYLSLKRAKNESGGLPVLLGAFENEYLPKYRGIEKNSQKILDAWNGKNNLPGSLKAAVKSFLRDK